MSLLLIGITIVVAMLWTMVAIQGYIHSKASAWIKADESPIPDDAPWVDAVVPARNEAAGIEESLKSLLRQNYPRLRITVLDDQSVDETAEIVEQLARDDSRLKLVRGINRPAGWVGKTWALQQGVEATSADWLWFVDADMLLDPRALWTALREAQRTEAGLVSLLARPRCETFWQCSIATVVIETLSLVYPLSKVHDPNSPVGLAHGAFMLVRRTAHESIGGFDAVKSEIIEDIKYAARIKSTGSKIVARPAPLLSQTHMYGSFGDIWRGLRKNAYAGMDYLFYKYAFGMAYGLIMAWVPPLAIVMGFIMSSPVLTVFGVYGWLMQVLAVLPITIYLGIGPWWGLTLLLGGTAYVAIVTASVWHYHRDGTVLWKDRAFAQSDQSL